MDPIQERFPKHVENNMKITIGDHFEKLLSESPWRSYYGDDFCDLFEYQINQKFWGERFLFEKTMAKLAIRERLNKHAKDSPVTKQPSFHSHLEDMVEKRELLKEALKIFYDMS